jgi:hypothetical protein
MIMPQLNKSILCQTVLAQKSITEVEHLSYYPDSATNNFYLFPKVVYLKGMRILG